MKVAGATGAVKRIECGVRSAERGVGKFTAEARRRGGREGFPVRVGVANQSPPADDSEGLARWRAASRGPLGQRESGRGLPHSKTLARRPGNVNAAGDGRSASRGAVKGRQLLECAGPPALWRGPGQHKAGIQAGGSDYRRSVGFFVSCIVNRFERCKSGRGRLRSTTLARGDGSSRREERPQKSARPWALRGDEVLLVGFPISRACGGVPPNPSTPSPRASASNHHRAPPNHLVLH